MSGIVCDTATSNEPSSGLRGGKKGLQQSTHGSLRIFQRFNRGADGPGAAGLLGDGELHIRRRADTCGQELAQVIPMLGQGPAIEQITAGVDGFEKVVTTANRPIFHVIFNYFAGCHGVTEMIQKRPLKKSGFLFRVCRKTKGCGKVRRSRGVQRTSSKAKPKMMPSLQDDSERRAWP